MDLGAALIARLQGASAVSSIVGTKVYWIQRPQGDPVPAVVARYSGAEDIETLDDDPDLIETEARITIDCFGANNVQAKKLARAVKATLKPPAMQGSFSFDSSDVSGPIDLGEFGIAGWEHRATLDCVIRHGAET